MVKKFVQRDVRSVLLKSGMAKVVRKSLIAKSQDGRTLIGGLFSVLHKLLLDRLIFDRRLQNACEFRLRWARLLLGAMFVRIILKRGFHLRGSGMI